MGHGCHDCGSPNSCECTPESRRADRERELKAATPPIKRVWVITQHEKFVVLYDEAAESAARIEFAYLAYHGPGYRLDLREIVTEAPAYARVEIPAVGETLRRPDRRQERARRANVADFTNNVTVALMPQAWARGTCSPHCSGMTGHLGPHRGACKCANGCNAWNCPNL